MLCEELQLFSFKAAYISHTSVREVAVCFLTDWLFVDSLLDFPMSKYLISRIVIIFRVFLLNQNDNPETFFSKFLTRCQSAFLSLPDL